jgi:hypothetical protein
VGDIVTSARFLRENRIALRRSTHGTFGLWRHHRLASPLMIEQETEEAGLIRYALSSLFDPIADPPRFNWPAHN